MVSAPSVRRLRRQASVEARRERRAAARAARGGRPAPITLIALGLLALALLALGGVAVDRWMTDPLARGREALEQRDWRAARVDLLTAVAQAPREPARRLLLADALLQLGRGREAESQLREAQLQGVGAAAVRADLALALAQQGRDRDALALLAAGPVVAADRPLAGRVAGEAHYRLGRIDAARTAFDAAVRANPNDPQTLVAVAYWRLAEQDMPGAEAAADAARRAAPDDVRTHRAKALVVRERAGPVPALPWFEAALERDGDDVATLIDYAATLGDAGRHAAMLEPLRRAAAIDAENPRVLYLLAVIAARGDEPGLARGLLARIAGPGADLPGVLMLRAAVELMLEAPTAAAGYAERLVALQPDNDGARRLLAAAQLAAGNPRGAIQTLDPITTRSDADSWSLIALGRAYDAMAMPDQALAAHARGARLVRGDATALRAGQGGEDSADPAVAVPAIRARLATGNAAAALALAQRLATANPGVPQARLLVGDVYQATGNWVAAAGAYAAAAELRFDEATMLRAVSAAMRAGDVDRAGQLLALFLAANPENIAAMRIAAAQAADQRRWMESRDWLLAVVERAGTNDAYALAHLARAELESGEAETALAYAARAYRLMPANAMTSAIYGRALALTGDRAGARAMFDKALTINPADELARGWRAAVPL